MAHMPPYRPGLHYNSRNHIRALACAVLEDDKEKIKELLVELDREEARNKRDYRIVLIISGLFFALLIVFFVIAFYLKFRR